MKLKWQLEKGASETPQRLQLARDPQNDKLYVTEEQDGEETLKGSLIHLQKGKFGG